MVLFIFGPNLVVNLFFYSGTSFLFFPPLICLTETEQGVALAILRGVLDFKREPWPQISESAKSLVRQMLDPDPRKRLTAQQVLGKFL